MFISQMCIWSNTGRTAKAVENLLWHKRVESGFDGKTGKPPKKS